MLRTRIFCLLMLFPVIANAASMPDSQDIPLCEVPDSASIIYDSLGGMTPRTSNAPLLAIHANGKITLSESHGSGQRIEQSLDNMQVQQLLDFIIEQNSFFEIDVDVIQRQIHEEQKKSGRLFAIADSGESVIRICTGKRQKEVKFYALRHAARQFPEINTLQQLYAIEQALKRTATWVRIGGDEGAKNVLASVNEYLARKHPDIEQLTLKNLNTAVLDTDANLTAYFSRRGFEKQGAGMRNLSVTAYKPSGHDSRFTVTVNLE